MAKSLTFSEQILKDKGFVQQPDGSWMSVKTTQVNPREVKGEIVVKQKVNNSPDFSAKPVTEWFIPYQIPSKKNSRQVFVHPKTKKLMNIPSKAYSEYKSITKMYWVTFGKEFKRTIETLKLEYPLNIELTFIRKTNQLVDFFGPGESAFDLMTDFGWWEDDNKNFGKPFFGDFEVDKNNPGTRIKILLK